MNKCMADGNRLQILLSTYNGVCYIQEQLESFRAIADIIPYQVLIRDDGSTDGTKKLLSKYESEDNIQVVYGDNIGLNASYSWLSEHSDPNCDYFAISDQDDQWLDCKFRDALTALKDYQSPALFASCSVLTDASLNPVGQTYIPRRELSFYNALVQNPCPGHTQVLNKELMNLVRKNCHSNMVAFDWWVYLMATAFGTVIFSRRPTVNHRQHMHNTVGYNHSVLSVVRGRIGKVYHGVGHEVTRQNRSFLESVGEEGPKEYVDELNKFIDSQNSLCDRIKYIFSGKAYRQGRIDTLFFYGAYLLGCYREI